MSKEKIIYGSIKRKIVSSDLINERANRDFENDDGDALNRPLNFHGLLEDVKVAEKITAEDPILRNTHEFYEMTP